MRKAVKADAVVSFVEDRDHDVDDIDTGTRYDPAAPLSLASCYHCNPAKWAAGKPSSEKYRCRSCGRDVPNVCLAVPS